MANRRSALLGPIFLLASLGLAACASTPPKPAPKPIPAAAAPAQALPVRPSSGDAKFDAFLMDIRAQALAQGITVESFDRATAGIAPLPGIIAMNANQPEFTRPVWSYLDSACRRDRRTDHSHL